PWGHLAHSRGDMDTAYRQMARETESHDVLTEQKMQDRVKQIREDKSSDRLRPAQSVDYSYRGRVDERIAKDRTDVSSGSDIVRDTQQKERHSFAKADRNSRKNLDRSLAGDWWDGPSKLPEEET